MEKRKSRFPYFALALRAFYNISAAVLILWMFFYFGARAKTLETTLVVLICSLLAAAFVVFDSRFWIKQLIAYRKQNSEESQE